MPVLGGVVRERDRLRGEMAALGIRLTDRDQACRSAEAERDALRQQLAGLAAEAEQGYCHCCRQPARFQITGPWLRDQYVCTGCYSLPRQRHIQYVLDTRFPGWETGLLHESSPSNNLLARVCPGYSSSQYLEAVPAGQCDAQGVRSENLEALSFEDGSFDIVVTQDVMEHVFHPDRAAREILRVLKPGGAHVFTAPKHKGLPRSVQRARLTDGRVEHLLEPSYHGNPVGDGRALVTWDYGEDFEALLGAWTGVATTTFLTRDRRLGLDGEFLEVFVTRKPPI